MIVILREIPVVSITSIEDCTLKIHIDEFALTGGYRMVSPETQEFNDLQIQIADKQAQVNSSTGAQRVAYINELELLKQLSDSLLVKDEGECFVRLRYEATNGQGVEIPFFVVGLETNFVFYVSDISNLLVTQQANEYLTMREKAKLYILDRLKAINFLGLADNEYFLVTQ